MNEEEIMKRIVALETRILQLELLGHLETMTFDDLTPPSTQACNNTRPLKPLVI